MSATERQTAPLDAVLDDLLLTIDEWLRRARDPLGPGGSGVTEDEFQKFEATWQKYRPRAAEGTQTLAIVRTATTSHHGVRSAWFIRVVSPLKRHGGEQLT